MRSEDRLPEHLNLRSRQWLQYVNLRQADESLEAEQDALESEIEQTGELGLDVGRSYSFDLESYCVHAGVARPAHGDGLRIAPMRGAATSWIADILRTQGIKDVPQNQVQYLIWALLSDVRFDELSSEDQATLLRFYPDAATRFGNRRLERLASGALQNIFPDLPDSISSLADLRGQILGLRDNAQALEALLAPDSGRTQSLEVGWFKMDEGYFIHVTADGFSQVHFDLYVPPSVGVRNPSSVQRLAGS